MTLYRTFSGLTERNNSRPRNSTPGEDIEDQVILVSAEGTLREYQTTFLNLAEEGGETEAMFFRCLDEQFNKVHKFYKDKVEEVVKEAVLFNKQMEALIAFRIKVDKPNRKFDWEMELTQLASDVVQSVATIAGSTPLQAKKSERVHVEVIEEMESIRSEGSDESDEIIGDVNEEKPINVKPNRPSPIEVLNRVKIHKTNETPRSTIKGMLNVEEQLKRAFIEFCQKLRLLKNYSFLNLLAFSKIMKKYDKVASRNASRSYLNMVDNSYIGSSDEVTRLIERVEATFIKHFSNANRRKGMSMLRPKVKQERLRITFFLGLFTGCSIAILIALVMILHLRNIIQKGEFDKYMENMFPLYSLFAFIFLHMVMYAANIYFWRRYRVNYSFIFGFKQGTELGYREVLLVSMGLATLALAGVLGNMDMEIDPLTKDYKALTELLPLALLTLVLLITFCPLNIIYRSSRYFLLTIVFRCLCAPLYKVTLPDFFLADQITSQIQALRYLEFYVCYYGWGDFKQRMNTCKSSDIYNTFYFIIATIPYWSRLLQCLRRLYEERDPMQGYNGLKYLSTVVAVLMRTAYSKQKSQGWWVMALVTSVIATIFSTYWDLIVDWGLLQRNSKNKWLRDKLILPHKSVYFGVMVLNIILRLAWLQTVLNFNVSFLHRETLIAIVASLEIIRRGIWNFFRLENEHLNNVGKYRAFKSVPLPFNYNEDEDGDQ
ncbi:hypothetical protein GIB67_030661 [Kingdonia uniflora]|uniref:Uncharacterized protein n=1 Tax=Kingdonia uniflora TaxID=39325 RepID=A0A7J7NJ93_9MAGN|nr:hypothetical protein GIB67_030661 [Kingdonia uniflora]